MNRNKSILSVLIAVLMCLVLVACSGEETTASEDRKETAETVESQENTETVIKEESTPVPQDNVSESDTKEEAKVTDTTPVVSEAPASAATVSGQLNIKADVIDGFTCVDGIYTITKEGEYKISGKLENGMIVVNAPEAIIELDFADTYMTSTVNSLVFVEDAEEVTIKASEGTTNTFIDNRPFKSDDSDKEAGNAAIYSKDDLKIKGRGKLVVEGNYKNGIQSKNDIKIKNLTLEIKAADNALKGNDSVTIESGNVSLTAEGGNGIKTENNRISDKGNQKGNITIMTGSTVTITSKKDCMKAALDVLIDDGANVTENKLS